MKFFAFFLLCSIPVLGQNTLHLRLQNSDKESIPFASILLKRTTDSSLIKGLITDENGELNASK